MKIYYKAIVIKTVWWCCKERWPRIESPEINSHMYGDLIFNKDAKNTKNRERIASSTNGVGKTGLHIQNNELGSLFTPYTKSNWHGI